VAPGRAPEGSGGAAGGSPSGQAGRRGGLAEQVAERRAKRAALQAAGVDPYPSRFDRSDEAAGLRRRFGDLPPGSGTGEIARVAGRLLSIRGHGRLVFATLRDESGSLQLMLQLEQLTPESGMVLANTDVGDWVGAAGEVVTTRRGELSVDVRELRTLAKALRPLPDKWHGLNDADTRYRQRELDLLGNEASRKVFETRVRTVSALRSVLEDEGFMEVETPVLQPQAGGALARPFLTRSNALDADLSLRIAPELYLKRLVVAGYERVYEIARVFRNEGIDTRHNPEFTVLEAYSAYGDYRDGMELTERLVVGAAQGAAGRLSFGMRGEKVDLTPPWPRMDLLDLVEEVVGLRLHPSMPVEDARSACDEKGVAYMDSWGSGRLIFEIYDKLLQPGIVGPVFVCGYPVEVSPLARHSQEDPEIADRFELLVGGRELANGYSELNDPDEQAERFARSAAAAAAGDLESHPADSAFVRALEYGLPPTSGIGLGVDRLTMLFAGVSSIRDVILFPMLRPGPDS
jgi:lysyl-tRNA synthetase class 2